MAGGDYAAFARVRAQPLSDSAAGLRGRRARVVAFLVAGGCSSVLAGNGGGTGVDKGFDKGAGGVALTRRVGMSAAGEAR